MGNGSIQISIGKFVPNKAGYAEVMNSAAIQNELKRKAESVKKTADGTLSEDGYALEGHEVKQFQGKLANGYVVRTKNDHARYAQAKRKTLTKAMGSAKG